MSGASPLLEDAMLTGALALLVMTLDTLPAAADSFEERAATTAAAGSSPDATVTRHAATPRYPQVLWITTGTVCNTPPTHVHSL